VKSGVGKLREGSLNWDIGGYMISYIYPIAIQERKGVFLVRLIQYMRL